jgi:mannose-6-phosphate isomerase-like protein (cupin superfamily)
MPFYILRRAIGLNMKIHSVSDNAIPAKKIYDPLDAVVAAPENHKILYEDDHVRVLEVTVLPGEKEKMHHHPCASVFAHDAPMPKFTNSFADDGSIWKLGRNLQLISSDPVAPADVVVALAQLNTQLDAAMSKGLPMAWSSPPQSTHSVHNLDTFPMHFYRIEFKRVEGDDIIKNGSSFY